MPVNDPTATIAQLLTIGFLLYIAVMFLQGLQNPKKYAFKRSIDEFDLGYMGDKVEMNTTYHPKPIELNISTKVTEKRQPPKKLQPVKKQPASPLFNECVLALRSVGYTAKEAKDMTERHMSSHKVDSVEQFIGNVFKS